MVGDLEEKQQRSPTITINLMMEDESGEENQEKSDRKEQSLVSIDSSLLGEVRAKDGE